MQFVEIYNYDERKEHIRVDQIESVCMPSGRVNDNGSIRLLGGRSVGFGHVHEAARVMKELAALALLNERGRG